MEAAQQKPSEPGAAKRTQILLLGGYSLARESMDSLLSAQPDFKVAAQCSSVEEALQVLSRSAVDVLLADVDMGEREFQHLLAAVKDKELGKAKVLVLTAEVPRSYAADLMRAGICGIFPKADSAASLQHAIRDVAGGNLWFRQEHFIEALNCHESDGSKLRKSILTRRESQVLSLVSKGFKNKDIGAQIGTTEGSVKATLQQLFFKFGVRTRSQLIRIALEQFKP